MIFAFITAWLAYKKAQNTGRNAILWAFVGAVVFVGTQLLVSVAIGIFIGLGIAFRDWSETTFDDYNIPITIIAVIVSFFTSWLLLRYLDKVPEESFEKPPEPPQF